MRSPRCGVTWAMPWAALPSKGYTAPTCPPYQPRIALCFGIAAAVICRFPCTACLLHGVHLLMHWLPASPGAHARSLVHSRSLAHSLQVDFLPNVEMLRVHLFTLLSSPLVSSPLPSLFLACLQDCWHLPSSCTAHLPAGVQELALTGADHHSHHLLDGG